MCLGGGSSTSIVPVSSSSSIPSWLNDAGKSLVTRADAVSRKPYTAYTGPRVAPLAPNQNKAISTAFQASGSGQPFIDRAVGYNSRAAMTWPEADRGAYMNPYMAEVLAPTLRELGEASNKERNSLAASSVSRGAFGGSRSRLTDADAVEKYLQTVGDVTGQAYGQAYNTAMGAFGADRDALSRAATTEAQLGAVNSGLFNEDIDRLLGTGALDRGVTQANYDVAFNDFLEQRGWDERQLDTLIRAIAGVPYDTTTTSQQIVQNPNDAAQIAGLGIAGGGLLASIFGK